MKPRIHRRFTILPGVRIRLRGSRISTSDERPNALLYWALFALLVWVTFNWILF
jgi:hypothetical protein